MFDSSERDKNGEEWIRIRKEAVVAYLQMLSLRSPVDTKENREKLLSGLPINQRKFDPEVWNVTATPTCSVEGVKIGPLLEMTNETK
jgi:hypothetical protein